MSTPATGYMLIKEDSEGALERSVDEELAKGWKLQGGVSVALAVDSEGIHHTVFAQAMTLDTAPTST